jgi:hypothetical protein
MRVISFMAQDIILLEAEIELLREACSAKGGAIRVDDRGDIQVRLGRTANARRLESLGYFEPAGDGWRIKPALRAQVKAVLREHDG